jgi:sugar lactone lactonase YvrE
METKNRLSPGLTVAAVCLLGACSADPQAGITYSDGQGGSGGAGGVTASPGGAGGVPASGGSAEYYTILCTGSSGLHCPTGGAVPEGCVTGYFPTCSTRADSIIGGPISSGGASGSGNSSTPTLVDCGASGTVDIQSNNNHCGGCGVECSAIAPSTAQCLQGRCVVTLAKAKDIAGFLAVDATSAYWTTTSNDMTGSVMKVSRRGGVPTMLATHQLQPTNLVVDATHVYWVNYQGGAVMKVPLAGGSPTTLAAAEYPQGLAVDATSVYWTSDSRGPARGSIMKVPLEGGEPITLAAWQSNPASIKVDATSVYWDTSDGAVMKVPLGGGEPITLVARRSETSHIAIDSTYVYWGDASGVMKLALQGGIPIVLDAKATKPSGLAVDASSVYYGGSVLQSGWGVQKIPLEGGPSEPVVVPSSPAQIVVDATSVFWTECTSPDGGFVKMATPK